MRGSVQQQRYLVERHHLGKPIGEACAAAEIGEAEARLIDKDFERGLISTPATSNPAAGIAAHEEKGPQMPQHDDTTVAPDDNDPLVTLAADTLRGDVRDSLLAWFKAQPKSWPFLSEREQRDLADAADRYSETLVKQACKIIASGERPCIVATLVEYKEKDGVEAKLKLPSRGEVVQALHEACGREVLIVTSGAEEYLGESAPAEIKPDQPELGIGDEYNEAA